MSDTKRGNPLASEVRANISSLTFLVGVAFLLSFAGWVGVTIAVTEANSPTWVFVGMACCFLVVLVWMVTRHYLEDLRTDLKKIVDLVVEMKEQDPALIRQVMQWRASRLMALFENERAQLRVDENDIVNPAGLQSVQEQIAKEKPEFWRLHKTAVRLGEGLPRTIEGCAEMKLGQAAEPATSTPADALAQARGEPEESDPQN